MLRSTKANLHVLRGPNPLVRCRCAPGPEAKQRLKGGHGLPPTVVPEHELVQVDLELRSVIRADQPLLQVAIARSTNGTTEAAPLRKSLLRG